MSGNAESGLSPIRFIGGLPRVLPFVVELPLRHAEDTTLAPCLRPSNFALEGVMAERGSDGSAQNARPFTGVIAECG